MRSSVHKSHPKHVCCACVVFSICLLTMTVRRLWQAVVPSKCGACVQVVHVMERVVHWLLVVWSKETNPFLLMPSHRQSVRFFRMLDRLPMRPNSLPNAAPVMLKWPNNLRRISSARMIPRTGVLGAVLCLWSKKTTISFRVNCPGSGTM